MAIYLQFKVEYMFTYNLLLSMAGSLEAGKLEGWEAWRPGS
jgi:hypothetical protein